MKRMLYVVATLLAAGCGTPGHADGDRNLYGHGHGDTARHGSTVDHRGTAHHCDALGGAGGLHRRSARRDECSGRVRRHPAARGRDVHEHLVTGVRARQARL